MTSRRTIAPPHLRTIAPPHRRAVAPSHRRAVAPSHRRAVLAAALLVVAASTAYAHHSIAGMYDNQRPVTIDGVVVQFQFVRPHPFLDLRDARTSETWRFEMDSRGELAGIGMDEQTLKPGDRLIVTGSLARREPSRAYVERLQRPADGYGYEQVRNSPRRLAGGR